MLGITKFELAIIEFGVANALEYFATPEEHHHLWDDKWEAEVKAKADEWYKLVGAKNTEQQVQPDNSPKMCEECGEYPADLPSKLCCGCDAYKEHLS